MKPFSNLLFDLEKALEGLREEVLTEERMNDYAQTITELFRQYEVVPKDQPFSPSKDTLLTRKIRSLRYVSEVFITKERYPSLARRFVKEWAYEDEKLPGERRQVFLSLRPLLDVDSTPPEPPEMLGIISGAITRGLKLP